MTSDSWRTSVKCFECIVEQLTGVLKCAGLQLARRRVVTLGAGRLHEELTFLDNDRFSL